MDKASAEAILKDLITIKTVNDNEKEVADYLAGLFTPYQDQGVIINKIEYSPGRNNLIVTIGEGERALGFSGHQDVVDPGALKDWQTDPFDPAVIDGRLIGRGASDMKSGLAAIVCALLNLLEEGAIPGKIKLVATVGEESGEYGAAQLTDAGWVDDLSAMVICEPSDGMKQIQYTSKGIVDYYVTSKGKAAHSSKPEQGEDAIAHLLEFATAVQARLAKLDRVDPVLGRLTSLITTIKGGEQINSVPSFAELSGNIRTIPGYTNQVIFGIIDGLIEELNQRPGYQLSVRYSYPEEPMPGQADSPLIKQLQKISQEVFGRPLTPVGGTGASDGSEFIRAKAAFPIVMVGPGSDSQHQPNEWVSLAVYHQAIRFYQRFIQDYFA